MRQKQKVTRRAARTYEELGRPLSPKLAAMKFEWQEDLVTQSQPICPSCRALRSNVWVLLHCGCRRFG